MPLVFAAVVPHSPLLVPAVAKDHLRLVTSARQAVQTVAAECYARQPECLILLTPHGVLIPGTVTANQADRLTGSLAEFGDVTTQLAVHGAVGTTHRLKELAEDMTFPMQLQTFTELDYGTVVPLTYFLQPQPDLPVMPLHVFSDSGLMIRLGQLLADFISTRPERFALLASADLFRSRAAAGTGPRRPTPEERTVAEAISAVDGSALTELIQTAGWCGGPPLLACLTAVAGVNATGVIRGFDAPLDIGLLTATFDIPA